MWRCPLLDVGATAIILAAACATTPAQAPHCGAEQIDRTAPVISGGDVVIPAPPEAVWAVHTDVAAWPTWRRDVSSAERLDPGPLQVGSRFVWSNGDLAITSTVRAVEQDRCTLWTGPANGIDGTHLWTFTAVPEGTLVHTEESWSGDAVDHDVARAQAMLDAGLSAGREDLRAAVDERCHCAPPR